MSSSDQCCRITGSSSRSKGEHRAFRFETEQHLADRFEMSLTALILLDDRMDVTKPPLERVVLEDRGGTGGMIGGVDDVARLVDRPGRSQADGRIVVDRQPARLLYRTPDAF